MRLLETGVLAVGGWGEASSVGVSVGARQRGRRALSAVTISPLGQARLQILTQCAHLAAQRLQLGLTLAAQGLYQAALAAVVGDTEADLLQIMGDPAHIAFQALQPSAEAIDTQLARIDIGEQIGHQAFALTLTGRVLSGCGGHQPGQGGDHRTAGAQGQCATRLGAEAGPVIGEQAHRRASGCAGGVAVSPGPAGNGTADSPVRNAISSWVSSPWLSALRGQVAWAAITALPRGRQ